MLDSHDTRLEGLLANAQLLATQAFNHSTVMGSSQWAKLKGMLLPLHIQDGNNQEQLDKILADNNLDRKAYNKIVRDIYKLDDKAAEEKANEFNKAWLTEQAALFRGSAENLAGAFGEAKEEWDNIRSIPALRDLDGTSDAAPDETKVLKAKNQRDVSDEFLTSMSVKLVANAKQLAEYQAMDIDYINNTDEAKKVEQAIKATTRMHSLLLNNSISHFAGHAKAAEHSATKTDYELLALRSDCTPAEYEEVVKAMKAWAKKPATIQRFHTILPDLIYMLDGYQPVEAVHPEPRDRWDIDSTVQDLFEEHDEILFNELTESAPEK